VPMIAIFIVKPPGRGSVRGSGRKVVPGSCGVAGRDPPSDSKGTPVPLGRWHLFVV
jgi:hypothetical protein